MLKRATRLLILYIMILTAVFPAVPVANATPMDHPNTYKNTGDMRADIIGVALTQVGYYEGSNNDTKYGVWYGLNNRAWCGIFVAWCADQAGIPKSIIPKNGTTNPAGFKATVYSGKNFRPQPGDLFFSKSGNGYSHVGIVYYLDGDYFYTLEGNTYHNQGPEGVYIRRRKIADYDFGVPNYPVGNEHSYYVGYETAHPHKEYYKCDHCGDKYYTGKTQTSSTCRDCTVANCSHSYGKWSSTGASQHTRSCSKCGKKETANHTWDSGTTTKQPTCNSQGVSTKTCTACSATRTSSIPALTTHNYGAWTYKNEKQHTRSCRDCTKKETAAHRAADSWTTDEDSHWYACTDCDGHIQEEKHRFDTQCDAPCQICGFLRPNGHSFSTDWKTDSSEHWHACEICDAPGTKGVHIYDNSCDGTCNICGYDRQVQHAFSEQLLSDATGHWGKCVMCGFTAEVQPHEPGAVATEEQPQLCTLCGWELAPKLPHSHDYKPSPNTPLTHSMICDCGVHSEDQWHSWDVAALRCSICLFDLKESLPTLILLCAIPVAALLSCLVLMIHWLKKRTR